MRPWPTSTRACLGLVYRMRSTKGTFRALGPKAWTALRLGKPQALTDLSESRPSEPGWRFWEAWVRCLEGSWEATESHSFSTSGKEFEPHRGLRGLSAESRSLQNFLEGAEMFRRSWEALGGPARPWGPGRALNQNAKNWPGPQLGKVRGALES